MSATKVTGVDAVLFWAVENGFKNGGVGMPATGTAVHQPFNPCEGRVNLQYPFYEEEYIYTQGSLDANINLSYSKALKPGEGLFPNERGMIYHDPMLMCSLVFTHKTTSGTWGGGASTYGQITGDFTDNDDEDTVMIQYKTLDDVGGILQEKTLLGVMATEFRIGFDKGGVLRTKYNLKAAKQLDNTRAYSASASFDDGTWGDWAKSTNYPAKGCRVYWDNSHVAQFQDINVYSCWFIFNIGKDYDTESGSLGAFVQNAKNREFLAEITGNVKGDNELDELDSILSSRTKKDLRLQWDLTSSEEKFIDIQNAHFIKIDARYIPSAEEKYVATVTLKGTTADYEGNFENLADPSSRITTT